MEIIYSTEKMRLLARAWHERGRVAVVPTMGYLHAGHASLMGWGRRNADRLTVSIFVNPTQFGPHEDLGRYPRDLERDASLCRDIGVDALFVPEAAEMYPPGYQTWVRVEGLSQGLCGAARPGHFRGVATVVLKLLNIISPQLAVFGLKDYQQYLLIRRMVADLNLGVQIVGRPTVREEDGLAMSSRNACLSPQERTQARVLSQALRWAQQMYDAGERDAAEMAARLRELIAAQPAVRLEYLAFQDPETLQPVEQIASTTLLALAAFVGATRLIDNTLLAPSGAAEGERFLSGAANHP
ncbi:MAG: pantoate--beta-alanine ligase [Pseudomonadota bacterium]